MFKKMFKLDSEGGYSFIELIVAVTILAIVIIPVTTLLVSGYTTMAVAGRQTAASNLCRDKIEEIKAMGHTGAYAYYIESSNSPELENPVPGFDYFRRVTEVDEVLSDVLSDAFLLRIRVTVSYEIENVTRSVEMQTTLSRRD